MEIQNVMDDVEVRNIEIIGFCKRISVSELKRLQRESGKANDPIYRRLTQYFMFYCLNTKTLLSRSTVMRKPPKKSRPPTSVSVKSPSRTTSRLNTENHSNF